MVDGASLKARPTRAAIATSVAVDVDRAHTLLASRARVGHARTVRGHAMVFEALLGDGASAVGVHGLAERHHTVLGGALEAYHRGLGLADRARQLRRAALPALDGVDGDEHVLLGQGAWRRTSRRLASP
jgi:hypothetical protein